MHAVGCLLNATYLEVFTKNCSPLFQGIFPFGRYKKGQDIKVKIIGFRHFKSFK